MAVEFATEPLSAVWDEAQPLLVEHWREVAFFSDIPLEPRRGLYDAAEAHGLLRVFTARDGGALVGYSTFMVDTALHYANSRTAMPDILFLLPAYRDAGNGAGLIRFCEEWFRADGVQCIYQHVKHALDFSPLLLELGYQAVETIYVKRLDHGD